MIHRCYIILFICVIGLHAYAQPQYTINISKQQYQLRYEFLKMGTNISPSGEMLSYNSMYLTRNNKPWFPIMGEMHFSQIDEKDWENIILKMKAGGVEVIAVYIFWIHHEEREGIMDWTGNRNLRKFLLLCKKYRMYVWLRPGPWIHAEARNGGFPDWLQNKPIKLRTNDSIYLSYAQKWFSEIAKQCEGFWYKQSSTIIGVQIENEMVFKSSITYQHMKTLKNLAIEVGMDAPYYSAFAQGPDDQDAFIYTLGGYADSPWGQHTKRMYKPVFFIKPLEADSDIGSDLFGKVDSRVRNTYPKLSAELGAGMQKTYHRRVDVSDKDIGATSLTRIASGLNGMGYFMYAGGHNPIGKTPMVESRVTGYPNDMPYINYDFQAPIGDMGIIRESYKELRLLNLFLQDFGSKLATTKPFFPKKMVSSFYCYDTVQASIRIYDNQGFIFLSNYQRFLDMPSVKEFQLHFVNERKQMDIPRKPVQFNGNTYAIWPYNMRLGHAIIKYATAQPLCILRNKEKDTYIFFSDGDCEFVLDTTNILQYDAHNGIARNEGENICLTVEKNKVANYDFTTAYDKKQISLLVLTRAQALNTSKIKFSDKEMILISRDNIMWDDHELTIEHISNSSVTNFMIYPKLVLQSNGNFTLTSSANKESFFASYKISTDLNTKSTIIIEKHNLHDSIMKDAVPYQESILSYYATSKRFNRLQPGPLYQPEFHNLPSQHLYYLKYNLRPTTLVKSWIEDINYEGDVMALYKNDKLLYDQFNYENHCNYKLSFDALKCNDKLVLQILPVQKKYDIYVEDKMKSSKEKDWTKGILKQITLTPIYNYKLRFH